MEMPEKRAAEIEKEVRKLALILVASGAVDVINGEPDCSVLVKAYENYSRWVAKSETIVVANIAEIYESCGKKEK